MLFVNGIPLVLCEFKEPGRSVRAAYDENLTRLPRHDPAAFLAERLRDPFERLGGAAWCDLALPGSSSASGSGSTARDTRAVSSSRRRSEGLVSPRASARSGRELRRLQGAAGRAGEVARPLPPVLRRQRGDGGARRGSGRAATSSSASSGTPRARARASRCSGSRRRCCASSPGAGRS